MNRLLLVNAAHPCPFTRPEDLVSVASPVAEVTLVREAADALSALISRLKGETVILPVSGWRSAEEQSDIWESSLRENGPVFTQKYVARPGCSEHQTGLAIDLGIAGPDLDMLCPEFPETGIAGAFRSLAAEYGFVERYPAGKEQVTGIAYEPWHFRYVGAADARNMKTMGLALEEYVALRGGTR